MNLTSLTSSKSQLQGKEIARGTKKKKPVYFTFFFPVILSILTVRADVMEKTKNDNCRDKLGNMLELHKPDDPS